MHVLCRNISAASKLLHIAVTCGFRESGISVSGLESPHEKVLVAIRTTAIRAEIPLAFYDSDNFAIRPLNFTREYLMNVIAIINEKFAENNLRKEKLRDQLRSLFSTQKPLLPNETKEERRNRKRMEGLQIQAEHKDCHLKFIEHNNSLR